MGPKNFQNRFFAPFWYFGATDDTKSAKNVKIAKMPDLAPIYKITRFLGSHVDFRARETDFATCQKTPKACAQAHSAI